MDPDLSSELDRCLDDLAKGRSLDAVLSSSPEASDLAPLLSLAAELKTSPQPEPRHEALQALLVRAGAALPGPRPCELPDRGASRTGGADARGKLWTSLRWTGALAASAVVAFGISTAASQSLPGSIFYPIKLLTERVTFALTAEPTKRAELRLSFADDRLDELVRSAQRHGKLDPALLRQVLHESELALQDAQPLPEPRFKAVLAKLNTSNSYQRTVFAQVNKWLPAGDRGPMERAISACDERERWMQGVLAGPEDRSVQESPGHERPGQERPGQKRPAQDRSWGPGCSCD